GGASVGVRRAGTEAGARAEEPRLGTVFPGIDRCRQEAGRLRADRRVRRRAGLGLPSSIKTAGQGLPYAPTWLNDRAAVSAGAAASTADLPGTPRSGRTR